MGQQVGEAFVRIRPNMSTFKSETETGVKSSFSSLAKIAGLAFGGAAVGALVKSSVEAAASSEAITNSVRSQFGKLGESVTEFAAKQGAAFGAFETNTNQTSYALGKLFINAGQNTKQAAMMTTQWEKLALALNQARGGGVAGAAEALQRLQVVASGASTRGLRELGITITSAQVAARAAGDGFIKLGQSAAALTPAERQLVTFQLAMRALPEALRQAAANSHSFAAEQARLAVAWDNAKTALGTAFLPLLTSAANALTGWLTKMERSGRLQRDFNQIASVTGYVFGAIKDVVASGIHIWDRFAGAVGGARHALILLGSAFALLKVGGIGRAARADAEAVGSRVGAMFTNIRNRAKASSGQMAQDYMTASAKIIRQTEAMQKAGSNWSTQAAANASKVKSATGKVGGSFGALDDAMKASAASAKTNVGAMNKAMTQFGTTAKKQATGFRGAITKASTASAAAFTTAATGMKAAAIEVGLTIRTAIIETGIGLLVVAIGIAVGWIITHWDTVKRYTIAVAEAIAAAWKGLEKILIGVGKVIAGSLTTSLTLPLRGFLEAAAKVTGWLSFIPGFSGFHAKIEAGLNALKSVTTGLVMSGAKDVVAGVNLIGKDAGAAFSKALQKGGDDQKVHDNAKKAGQNVAKSLMGGAATGVAALAPSVGKAIQEALQNAVAAAHRRIMASVHAAKSNLDKIGQDLAKTIADIQAKIGGAAGAVAGSPQGAAFAKLKKLIESGAPSFQIGKAQAELAGQLQNVGKTQKEQVSGQLANLTAAFNKGEIGYREFEKRLHKILHDNGITMAQALKAGGKGFAETYRAEVAALSRQAKAIAAIPAKFRGIGGAGGAADIKIIQPLNVIKQENAKIHRAIEKAAAAAQRQREKFLKNQAKQIALAEIAKSVGVKVHIKQAGTPHGTIRADIAGKIADHTRRIAENTAPGKHRGPKGPEGPLRPKAPPPTHRGAQPQHAAALAHSLTTSFSRMASELSHLRPDLQGIKSAIQNEQAVLLRGLREVCSDIAAAEKNIVAAELGLHSPIENLRRTELRIAEHAAQQRDRQIRVQQHTNTLLARLNRDKGVPGFNKERPGTGSKNSRKGASVGVKP